MAQNKNGRLQGKVAVVTGASKGIGAGIAKALADEGASVVVNYSTSKDGAERVVAEITSAGGKALAVQGDVSRQSDITHLFDETKKAFGRLDVLVNNAGIYEFASLEAVTEESFHKQFNLNVLGLLLTTKEAVAHFGAEGGSIINISSGASKILPPNASVYVGTKAAVDAITGSLAKELGPRKIRVNSINPGMIETEGVHAAGIIESDFRTWIEAHTPLGRIGQTGDISPTAVYLASADSQYLTGETLQVTGGASLMTSEARLVAGAINYWKLVAGRADRFFSALTEEQLLNEVAPGKNRLIYLPGHLTAVHDAMFSALGVGERLHPELDAVFLSSPDKTVAHIPSGVELQAWWKEVNEALLARFTELPAEAWLQKHTLVSESDFEKEPDRNRLAILLSRTNHASFHLGQAILAGKIPT